MTLVRGNKTLQTFKILQMETGKVDELGKDDSFKCKRQIQDPCCIKDGAICGKNQHIEIVKYFCKEQHL